MIGGRVSLWGAGNGSDCTTTGVDALLHTLSQQSKDPTTAGGYSLVPVHAWSHNVTDIQTVANALRRLGGFRVVGANELVDLLVQYHPV